MALAIYEMGKWATLGLEDRIGGWTLSHCGTLDSTTWSISYTRINEQPISPFG